MLLSHLFEDPDIMAVVRLGDVTVEVHRHLADQQRKRRVSDRRVEEVLRQIHMVPRRQMMSLPHGQRFWVYDPKNDTALGYTMISPERRVLRLKTTVPNRPWDSDRPIFDLPGQRPLQEVSGFGELDVSERLQKYFTDRGYDIVSEGRDQMVFHRPGQRHVIKVIGQSASGVERGEAIADYVRFFAMNQGNPHFPRVSQPRDIDVGGEVYTIYRQELLQDLSDDEEERLLDWIQAFGQALGDPMGPGMVKAWLQNNPPPGSLPLRQVQGVYAAVTKLLQHYGDDLGREMRLDLGHAANFMQRADGTIVVVDPIAYDEEYGMYSESIHMKMDEITRRGVLKGIGAAAGAAALPPKTLARTIAPTSTVGTSEPITGYVWNRVGDAVDQKHLSGLVDRITQGLTRMYQARQAEYHSETEIRDKLNAILRKHIPGMSQKDRLEHGKWEAMMQDFDRELPLPALPPDVPDLYNDSDQVWAEWLEDHPQWDYNRLESMLRRREDVESNIKSLAITTRAANMGDTENYGYQVQHKIKTGRIKPVDYSKPSTSVATQAAQTAATQIPRTAAASALGSAGAALRKLGSRARDLVTKKAASAVVKPDAPRALAAPSTDTEFMRDLQNRVAEPQKQKVNEITVGSEEELFAGGGFLPRIDVDPEDADVRPLDRRYALWPQRHIQEIAREDDAIGEQFPDWETAGILDTQTGRAVAVIAWQEAYRSPFPGAVEIHQVEVDPRLRGQGFARYLYELVRRQHTLLADEDQTPNGARMWVGMEQAGLPVQGYISFGSGRTPEELDAEGGEKFSYVEELKKMNAKPINSGGRFPVYVFPVRAQGGRLDTPVNTPLKVYRSGYTNQWTPGLVVTKGG